LSKRLDEADDDALSDLDRDFYGEDGVDFYSRHAKQRNWPRRIVVVVGLLAAAFIVLAITGIHL
jgi:hypothetical protein